MYKIAMFFRKTAQPNIFRKLILNSLSSDFDEYCICSAFFQEPYKYKNGRMSGTFSTSKDIENSLSLQNNKIINIYGLYSSNPFTCKRTWETQFRLFCQKINLFTQNNPNLSCSFYKFKNQSHAKIFFAKKKNDIRLAIIGSSNVSAGAFADRTQKESWNHESDVIFWNEGDIDTNKVVLSIFEDLDDASKNSIFIMDYDEQHFLNQMTLKGKLEVLEKDMMSNVDLLT